MSQENVAIALTMQRGGGAASACLDSSSPTPVGSARGSPLGRKASNKEGKMVSQRKRPLFLGLGLTVALVLAVGLLPAAASAASTLTGRT